MLQSGLLAQEPFGRTVGHQAIATSNGTPFSRRGTTAEEARTVVVTGVAGFIGSHLAEALLAEGHEVIGIDRRSPVSDAPTAVNLAALLPHPRFRLHCGEVGRGTRPLHLLDGAAVVFHLAAATGVRSSWGQQFSDYTASNVLATQRLLEACIRMNVPRMVIASSSSVYGQGLGRPSREDDPTSPLSPYGVSKLAAEQLAIAYGHRAETPIEVAALRYFTVYGPRQREDMVISRMLRAVLSGVPVRIYGSGQQRRNFTYVGDVVRATVLAGRVDLRCEVINIAGSSSTSLRQMLELVAEITEQPVPLVSRDRQEGDVEVTEADLSRAGEVLDYRPAVDLPEGLTRQWNWLKAIETERATRRSLS